MKSFLLSLSIAILLISASCLNNPTGDRVPDINKTLVAKISTTASDTVLIGQAIILSAELSKAPEGDPIASYQWSLGDSTFATGKMTQHKYTTEGSFIIQLKVTTASGLANSTTKTMVVVDHFEEKTPTWYLISSEAQSDGSYIYHVGALISAVKGDRSAPFHVGDYNGWKAAAITDSSREYYFYSIRTFDTDTDKIQFGGKYPDSWASIKYSIYYDATADALMPAFKGGKVYVKGHASIDKIPGEIGDSVVRFSIDATNLTIYFNNREKIAGAKDQSFWVSTIGGWTKPQAQFLVGSTGWGYALVPIGDLPAGSIIDFKFGGNYTSDSWADMSGSFFYDSKKICLSAKLVEVDASAKIAGGKSGAIWTVVPVK